MYKHLKKINFLKFKNIQWIAGGVVAQILVFIGDLLTPLGFAHGVLYVPAIFLVLFSDRLIIVWMIAFLGVVGNSLGMFFSNGIIPEVGYQYIILNRILGYSSIIASAAGATVLLRLYRKNNKSKIALEQTTSLLEVSNNVGGLGGWRVELPGMTSYWSDQVFKLFGRSPSVIPDISTIISWYALDYQSLIQKNFNDCINLGNSFDVEVQVIYPNDTHHWVRVVGKAVFDGSRIIGAQGAIQDIDKHKEVQAKIESSREEWRLLAESLPMIVWVTDSQANMSYVNQFTADYMGSDVNALMGNGWLRYVHPDDQNLVEKLWVDSVGTGMPYLAEFRVRRNDGLWRWHAARAVCVEVSQGVQWYGTAMDMQDFRNAQQERTQLANRLVDTMESVGDAIFVLDRNWIFTYMNRQCEKTLNRSREELLHCSVWDAFPEAKGSQFQQEYERCVREGVTVRFDADYAPLNKHFEVNAYPYDGGVVVYFRDVTEQRRLAMQVQQGQRMESLGHLTGGVAHDFNNLLTVILGNSEILSEQFAESSQERELLDMITSAAEKGAEMTQRLLTFARKQVLSPKSINLNNLLKEITPLLTRSVGSQFEIKVIEANNICLTHVDPNQLEMVLLNLVVNARDAMPSGGHILIETANVYLDDDYAAQYIGLKPGSYVMLAVSDTGEGISQENLEHVFEPFFTTKEQGKGTGLGLPMVYGFVKQSNGHIAIYSEKSLGTAVKIYLPCAEEDEHNYPVSHGCQEQLHDGQGRKILLVEDDLQVRKVSKRQLEMLGYCVTEASNGQEALEFLKRFPEIDLLLTDVIMPGGMSGRELAQKSRILRPGLPIIFASGYTGNAIVNNENRDVEELILTKPYFRSQLADKIYQAFKNAGENI